MTRNHESHFVPISTFRYVVTLRTTLAEIDHRQLPKYVRRASARKHSANTLQPLQLPSKYGASLASFVYENEKTQVGIVHYAPVSLRAAGHLLVTFSSLTRCLVRVLPYVGETVIRFPPEARHHTGRTCKFDRSKH